MELISKAAVVAELERRKKRNVLNEGAFEEDIDILSFIKNLEVKKDVDLKEDVDRILYENDWDYDEIDFYEFAKHFFELGLKTKKGE